MKRYTKEMILVIVLSFLLTGLLNDVYSVTLIDNSCISQDYKDSGIELMREIGKTTNTIEEASIEWIMPTGIVVRTEMFNINSEGRCFSINPTTNLNDMVLSGKVLMFDSCYMARVAGYAEMSFCSRPMSVIASETIVTNITFSVGEAECLYDKPNIPRGKSVIVCNHYLVSISGSTNSLEFATELFRNGCR